MPSRSFSDIGSGVEDFFDEGEYSFGRTIKMNVKTDVNVNWSLKTQLGKEVDSEFEFAHKIGSEKISVTTKTLANPKFALKTSRIQGLNTSITLEEPKLKFGLGTVKEKFSADAKLTYVYGGAKPSVKSDLNFAYEQGTNLTIGAEVSIAKKGNTEPIQVSDYNARAEFRRNENQTFSLQTQDKASMIQVGAEVALPRGFTGYFQIGSKSEEQKADPPAQTRSVLYAAGVSYPFDEQNEIRALFRSDRSSTIAYSTQSTSAFGAYFAYNRSGNGDSLEYKLVFG